MELKFEQSYLSINAFPTVQLPSFCLITGPNGAGKSHLLQALHSARIKVDCAPNQSEGMRGEIRLFDWNNLVPQDTGVFSSDSLRAERVNTLNNYNNLMRQAHALEPLRNIVRQFKLPETFLTSPLRAAAMSVAELAQFVGEERAQSAYHAIQQAKEQGESFLMGNIDQASRNVVRSISYIKKTPMLALSQEDILSTSVPSWGNVDVFQQSFARLFVAYRDLLLANLLAQFRASKDRSYQEFLTDDEFVAEYGKAPWDFVNESLEAAGLDFRINTPIQTDYAPFEPQLTKLSSGAKVPFSNLSSGEKVLMSFAFCVYYANDRRQIADRPKLLLLDEVDAPLHPSMSKSLVATIKNTLVDSSGINVIATTHSPSTVAIAPEESLYVMRPGVPGLSKITKSEALNVLTVGVPTLSISFDGRRQVFVESPSDARSYDALYRILKPQLNSERSLQFIATGTRSAEGAERNTGCDAVKRLVKEITDAGNTSVFGLIDWDGHNASDLRILVLSEQQRNGLENLVFDPLAISLLIAKSFPEHKGLIGIPDEETYRSFSMLNHSIVQPVVDRLVELVLEDKSEERTTIRYVGGLTLQIDPRYVLTDDHALESNLLRTFPFFKGVSKQQPGKLIGYVIEHVFADCVDAVPLDLKETFAALLTRDAHLNS
jgi:AAA15 family ATPase/GTPase